MSSSAMQRHVRARARAGDMSGGTLILQMGSRQAIFAAMQKYAGEKMLLLSRTVTPEPRRHVTVGRSHDQTGSDLSHDPPHDQSRDQAPKPASNQSCDKE